MKSLSLLLASALTISLTGCGPATPSGDDVPADHPSEAAADRPSETGADPAPAAAADQAPEINDSDNLARMAFAYLKTSDEAYLEHIWITPGLMKRIEEISGQEVPPENLDKHQDGIVASAGIVRKEAEKLGIDWTDAKLVKAESDASGEMTEYAPPPTESDIKSDKIESFEVYLFVESGETTVKLRLDDCLSIDGKHVVGDCFLAPTMEGW